MLGWVIQLDFAGSPVPALTGAQTLHATGDGLLVLLAATDDALLWLLEATDDEALAALDVFEESLA